MKYWCPKIQRGTLMLEDHISGLNQVFEPDFALLVLWNFENHVFMITADGSHSVSFALWSHHSDFRSNITSLEKFSLSSRDLIYPIGSDWPHSHSSTVDSFIALITVYTVYLCHYLINSSKSHWTLSPGRTETMSVLLTITSQCLTHNRCWVNIWWCVIW